MSHTSRTKSLLSIEEISHLVAKIKSQASNIGAEKIKVYHDDIEKMPSGEIKEKKKGNINAYIWGINTKKGNNLSMNLSVINGFEDPLFNDEGAIKIYCEIFPSASSKQRDSNIYDTFEKVQGTKKTKNFSSTKNTIFRTFKQLIKLKNKH